MSGKIKIDLSSLEEKWPSAFVAREVSKEFTGGLVSPKSLANLDSQGEGPEGAIHCGRKVIYPVKCFIAWLEKRSQFKMRVRHAHDVVIGGNQTNKMNKYCK